MGKARSAQDISTDLADILLHSRRENLNRDVTGVLVTGYKACSQVIEGPAHIIKNLIGHIACDQRHLDFRIIGQDTSDIRLFQEWLMAAISTGKGQEALDFLFPSFGERFDVTAIHLLCTSLRRYLLRTQAS